MRESEGTAAERRAENTGASHRGWPPRLALFILFAASSGLFFAAVMYVGIRYNYNSQVVDPFFSHLVGWVVPAIVCGLLQHFISRKAGVPQEQLQVQVAVSAVGAPLVGIPLTLLGILVFANATS